MTKEAAIAAVLKHEGGYVNDPADPGGETIYGISRRAHPEMWLDGPPTLGEATAFYSTLWDSTAGLLVGHDSSLRASYFDMAVNAGPKRANELLDDTDDPGDPGAELYTLARIRFYAGLAERKPALRKFFFGWVRRALSFL